MVARFSLRRHTSGFRDPFWSCDLFQLILCGGLIGYTLGPLAGSRGLVGTWGIPFVILWLIPVGLWISEWVVDRRTSIVSELGLKDRVLASAHIIGRPAQVRRIIDGGKPVEARRRRFRGGPKWDQQAALLGLVIIAFPLLLGTLGVRPTVLSGICLAAYGTVFLQVVLDRRRFTLESGSLIIERLSGWRVVDTESIPLTGKRMEADLAEGVLTLADNDRSFGINLRELYSPHGFVRALFMSTDDTRELSRGGAGLRP